MNSYWVMTANVHPSLTSANRKFYNKEEKVMKAENINNLRARIVREHFKYLPGKCKIYKYRDHLGFPDYEVLIGQIYHYGNGEYFYEIRDTHDLIRFDPKTGKVKR